jgi:hypothetical protein
MLRLLGLAALAALIAGGGRWALAGPAAGGRTPGVSGTTPAARKLSLRVGEQVEFRVDPAAAAGGARWRLDGVAVGTGPAWTFAPSAADVGHHVVLLATAAEPSGRRWDVRVRPPRLPRVASVSPPGDTVSVNVGRDAVLRFDARPATPGETVRVTWTVDGEPAGEGDTLRWRSSEPVNVRARAVALGSHGAAVGRAWRILVRLAPTTTTTEAPARVAAPERVEPIGPLPPTGEERATGARDTVEEQPAEKTAPSGARAPLRETPSPRDAETPAAVEPAAEPAPREVVRAEPPPTLPAPPPPPPPPAPTATTLPPPPPPQVASRGVEPRPAGGEDEVRRLLDRYAAAWRNHDVDELRRIGQVTSDSQAADLERYFAKVEDLDVEVHVIDIQRDGDRATVRFTRRDRFRDPTGRLVTEESPPIEKHVVRAADGLRFEPGAR